MPSRGRGRGNSDADFDPWAGKSLGEVSKPEGFDEFWADQQAGSSGGTSKILQKQDALVRSEEARLEAHREQRARGRGRRGYQRYSRPEPQAPRARPTHFVAIRLHSRMIRRNVQQMQRWFIDKDPLWDSCIVPVKRLHSSLLLTAIPHERRAEAQEACQEAGRELREFLGDQPVKLIASGVGHFNGQVLFTRIRTEPHEMLQAIHDALSRSFMQYGFPVLDESAKAWLEEGEEPHDFKAHASFLKASKALAHAKTNEERRSFRQLRLISDDIAAWRDVFFGSQLCHEFELLDMIGSSRDGYYPCVQCERLNDRPISLNVDPALVPMAAGPLRTGRLRVECEGVGAGMALSVCDAGYLVEQVEDWPGQPDLREGDAIVAIADSILLGLEESDLERCFGEAFTDGAPIIVGQWDVLQKTPKERVRHAAERLLRPWRHRENTSTEAASGTSQSSGLRYKLRTTAETFTPDPLNQPGGDPWANAAEQGYQHAAYTGWGTQFKTLRATKVQSSRFLPKAPRVAGYGEGEKWDEERTALHRRLQAELRYARSHEQILHVIEKNRALLSLANRAHAFSRLAACGWLSDNSRRDQRFRNLLDDAQEDLEAIVEAQAVLAPWLLSNLAWALGRLGLRRPEFFHALAAIVRRAGIWTFADNEVAILLEGFSRAKLSDEVIFQEAARLVVARVGRLAPRLLTLMLTAFACSSIATEHLFFVAGDAIIAGQKHFAPGLFAELADAFSRVRARHDLLLRFVPEYFDAACLADFKRCSIEALVKLFSAYVDVRQGLGFPEGFRETVAAALTKRRGDLTARLMRQVLQAMARARWPHATLLEIAAEVAARDPKPWELEAMHECFFQMRVTAPSSFPSREKDAGNTSVVASASDTEMTSSGVATTAEASVVHAARQHLRTGSLQVANASAGLELEVCEAGYYVEAISDTPGQPCISVGDAILAIGARMLLGAEEDVIEERFGAEFRDGTPLVLGPLALLQQVPLEDVRLAVQALLPAVSQPEPVVEASIDTGKEPSVVTAPPATQEAAPKARTDSRKHASVASASPASQKVAPKASSCYPAKGQATGRGAESQAQSCYPAKNESAGRGTHSNQQRSRGRGRGKGYDNAIGGRRVWKAKEI